MDEAQTSKAPPHPLQPDAMGLVEFAERVAQLLVRAANSVLLR